MPSSWLRPRALCLAGVLALMLHSVSVRAAEDPVYELTDADFEATTAEGTWCVFSLLSVRATRCHPSPTTSFNFLYTLHCLVL